MTKINSFMKVFPLTHITIYKKRFPSRGISFKILNLTTNHKKHPKLLTSFTDKECCLEKCIANIDIEPIVGPRLLFRLCTLFKPKLARRLQTFERQKWISQRVELCCGRISSIEYFTIEIPGTRYIRQKGVVNHRRSMWLVEYWKYLLHELGSAMFESNDGFVEVRSVTISSHFSCWQRKFIID